MSRVGVGWAIEVEHLEAELGQLGLQQSGEPRAEKSILMDQKDRLDRLAGAVVELDEIFERVRADNRGAGREAESILEVAGHDFVADADIDDIGQIVTRGGLRGGETDRAGKAANDGADILRRHALDFARAALGSRARVAEIGLDIGAAERLDAAGLVDRVDREFGPQPASLPV